MASETPIMQRHAVLGYAWQTAIGTANTTPQGYLLAKSVRVNPGRTYLESQSLGTHGSDYELADGLRLLSHEATVELELVATLEALELILEMHGRATSAGASGGTVGPYATTAASQITEAGDTNNDMGNVALYGLRPTLQGWGTTCKLYWECNSTTDVIKWYTAVSGGTQVCESAAITGTSTAIDDSNSSGVTGTIATPNSQVTSTLARDASRYHLVGQLSYQEVGPFSGYPTLLLFDGVSRYVAQDCVLQEFSCSSREREDMVLRATLLASKVTRAADTTTIGTLDITPFCHLDVTAEYDTGGSPITLQPVSVVHGSRTDSIRRLYAGNEEAQFYRPGRRIYPIEIGLLYSQTVDDVVHDLVASSATMKNLTITATNGARILTATYRDVLMGEDGGMVPPYSEGEWGDVELRGRALEDRSSGTLPATYTLDVI